MYGSVSKKVYVSVYQKYFYSWKQIILWNTLINQYTSVSKQISIFHWELINMKDNDMHLKNMINWSENQKFWKIIYARGIEVILGYHAFNL